MLTKMHFTAYSIHALRTGTSGLKHEIRGVDVLFCLLPHGALSNLRGPPQPVEKSPRLAYALMYPLIQYATTPHYLLRSAHRCLPLIPLRPRHLGDTLG